jgi:hypothetical protein
MPALTSAYGAHEEFNVEWAFRMVLRDPCEYPSPKVSQEIKRYVQLKIEAGCVAHQ